MKSTRSDEPFRLDELLPHYHFRERHARLVEAPADRVYDAMRTVTLSEMPLAPVLLMLRSLPAVLARREGLAAKRDEPLFDQMFGGRFTLLAEDPGQELVAGIVGQLWRPVLGAARVRSATEFLSFDRPGNVKAAMNLRLTRHEAGTWLTTETRVLATDAAGRRRFALYWLFIRPGSGLIRRSWLRAVALKAEKPTISERS